MSTRTRLKEDEYDYLCEYRKSVNKKFVPKEIFKLNGRTTYRARLSDHEYLLINNYRESKSSKIYNNGFNASKIEITEEVPLNKSERTELEALKDILDIREGSNNVKIYDIKPTTKNNVSESVPIFLLSDVHFEEVIKKESVLGMNEYNPEIAKKRLEAYFVNLVKLTTHAQRSYHNMNQVVIGVLGDLISNYIHEELQQTNAMSPLEAISTVKSIVLSGFKYIHDNLNVDKITVVFVAGNHGRSSQKTNFSNFTYMSYEYYLGVDIKSMCETLGLNKFAFVIPRSEMALIELFDKRLIFLHGTRIKGGNGVGGVSVPISRYFNRLARSFNADYMFLGHFHQSIYNKQFCVNGSVVGYSPYAMGNGCDFEVPQQSMVILDSKRGFTAYNAVYLD